MSMNESCIPYYTQGEHLVLHLHKPKTDKKVQWQEGTVDNEFMDKKKSKCESLACIVSLYHSSFYYVCTSHSGCCIYTKPHKFGESDSESDSDDDGDCCHEHKVARRKIPHHHDGPPPSEGGQGETS